MGDIARTRRIEVAPGDFVELISRDRFCLDGSIDDVWDFLEGKSGSFPQFDVPRYVDESEGDGNYRPSDGLDEGRLIAFAHLVRPFPWSDDPHLPEFRDLVARLQLGHAEEELRAASTQFLWDALFAHVRGNRFMDGLIASHAYGLTQIANEIRRRLLIAR